MTAENAPSEWDNIPQEFHDWWNADYDDSTNPFKLCSSAYWAWAGWQAAQQCKPLTDEQIAEIYAGTGGLDFYLNFARAIEAAHGIKEKT